METLRTPRRSTLLPLPSCRRGNPKAEDQSAALIGSFYHGGPGDEPGRACGDDRPRPRRSVGATAMCPARIGALWGLSPAGGAGCRRIGADAVDRRAVSGDTVLRLTADDGGAALGGPSGQPQASATADAADGARSAGPKAEDQPAGGAAPDLPLSTARAGDRSTEPSVGRRHPLHPDGPRLSLLGRGHGL